MHTLKRPLSTKRVLSSAVVFATLATGIAACGSTGVGSGDAPAAKTVSHAKALSVAFANFDNADATFYPLVTAIKADGGKLGWTVNTYDNAANQSTTLNNAHLMAADTPNVIIDFNGLAGLANALSSVFKNTNKPCIAVNTQIPGCKWFNVSNAEYGQGAGTALAQAANKRGWTAANTTFIAVNDPAAGAIPQLLLEYGYSAFTKTINGGTPASPSAVGLATTKIGSSLLQVNGQGDLADTTTALKSALEEVPSGRNVVVLTQNDDCGIGALDALRSAGLLNRALIASEGATPEGLKELRTNPAWVSEGAIYISAWSGYVLAMSRAMTEGQTLPELTPAPQNNLTKATVDQYFEGNTAIHVPGASGQSAYLLKTGVLQKLGLA